MEIWDLWYPEAASQGLPFARARIEHADAVLVHAAPIVLRVEVRDDAGALVALADGLRRQGGQFPITRLSRLRNVITRWDGWPDAGDIGRIVVLPGGEAGVLKQWWNAADGSAWRWQVEFYNHR